MNAISRRGDVRPDRRLRFPALPVANSAGTSFKHEHLNAILAESPQTGFFEVHAETYMGAGGPPHQALERIRREHPVSLHGVCMSIGGPQPLDRAHLARFRALVERYEPALVSEHLAWSTHETTYFNDLLPLPYTQATLAQVCEHIDEVQDAIERRILIENPSTYVAFASSTMSETDFIRAITCRRLLIDSHDGPVADAVWKLYEIVISRCGPIPTLIEWDSKIPAWPILRAEAAAAKAILDRFTAARAVGSGHAA